MNHRPARLVPSVLVRRFVTAARASAVCASSLAWVACVDAPSERIAHVAEPLSTGLVVSQVYGGGGNSSASFASDFVEIFNRGAIAVPLAGLSLQYASDVGNFAGVVALPAGKTVPAGGYFLVQMTAAGSTGAALPSPDFVAPTAVNMSATKGKVALVTGTTALGCGATASPCAATDLATIVDFVGYGASASLHEGSGNAPAPPTTPSSTTNTRAVVRKGAGCVETDDNAADFTVAPAAPRGATIATVACGAAGDAGVDAAFDVATEAADDTSSTDSSGDGAVVDGGDAGDDGDALPADAPSDSAIDADDSAGDTPVVDDGGDGGDRGDGGDGGDAALADDGADASVDVTTDVTTDVDDGASTDASVDTATPDALVLDVGAPPVDDASAADAAPVRDGGAHGPVTLAESGGCAYAEASRRGSSPATIASAFALVALAIARARRRS